MDGFIARLMGDKGFGFIKANDNKDYFFHRSEFSGHFDDLIVDYDSGRKVKVTFTPTKSDKGPRASLVQRSDDGYLS